MVLGSTQPLTEMSTCSISWGLTFWNPLGHSRPVMGLLLPLSFRIDNSITAFKYPHIKLSVHSFASPGVTLK